MSSSLATLGNTSASIDAMHAAMTAGDLSKLSKEEQAIVYLETCRDLGLNWRTKPFLIVNVRGGGAQLYPTVEGLEQLAAIHNVSTTITQHGPVGDLYLVRIRASLPSGRSAEKSGMVTIKGLSGDTLANAIMKAESKAYRRAVRAVVSLNSFQAHPDPTLNPPGPAIAHEIPEAMAMIEEITAAAPDAAGDEIIDAETGEVSAAPAAAPKEWATREQLDELLRRIRDVTGLTTKEAIMGWVREHGKDPGALTVFAVEELSQELDRELAQALAPG